MKMTPSQERALNLSKEEERLFLELEPLEMNFRGHFSRAEQIANYFGYIEYEPDFTLTEYLQRAIVAMKSIIAERDAFDNDLYKKELKAMISIIENHTTTEVFLYNLLGNYKHERRNEIDTNHDDVIKYKASLHALTKAFKDAEKIFNAKRKAEKIAKGEIEKDDEQPSIIGPIYDDEENPTYMLWKDGKYLEVKASELQKMK